MGNRSIRHFDSVTNPDAEHEPWRQQPSKREQLLEWFLDEDLSRASAIRELERLTGRTSVAGSFTRPDGTLLVQVGGNRELASFVDQHKRRRTKIKVVEGWVLPGKETGQLASREPCPPGDFIALYQVIQETLWKVQNAHHHALQSPRSPLSRFQRLFFDSFAELARLTQDIRHDAVRIRQGAIRYFDLPVQIEHRTLSLVGELALAMMERLSRAQSSVLCPYCGRVELFPDPRPRKKCRRKECQARYMHEYKREHPEDPGQVAERMRKKRARDQAQKKGSRQ